MADRDDKPLKAGAHRVVKVQGSHSPHVQALRTILGSVAKAERLIHAHPEATREQLLDLAVRQRQDELEHRKAQRRLVRAKPDGVDLRQRIESGELRDLIFVARALVLCGLPYKRTDKAYITKRARLAKDVFMTVTFQANKEGVSLPFGQDRVLLGWLQTMAKRQRSPIVRFDSALAYFKAFGIHGTGKDYTRFRDAMERLSKFSILVEISGTGQEAGSKDNVIRRWYMPTRQDVRDERTGLVELPGLQTSRQSRYFIEFDETFFSELLNEAVPVPLEVMRHYADDPISWDFIQFVAYRCKSAKRMSRIPWESLLEMLGSTDRNHSRLRGKLSSVLESLGQIWPGMNAAFDGKELVVGPIKDGLSLAPPMFLALDETLPPEELPPSTPVAGGKGALRPLVGEIPPDEDPQEELDDLD